jgi:hypothetical protein
MEPLAVVSSSLSFTFAHCDGSLLFDPKASSFEYKDWGEGIQASRGVEG